MGQGPYFGKVLVLSLYIYIFVHAKYEPDRPYIYFIRWKNKSADLYPQIGQPPEQKMRGYVLTAAVELPLIPTLEG